MLPVTVLEHVEENAVEVLISFVLFPQSYIKRNLTKKTILNSSFKKKEFSPGLELDLGLQLYALALYQLSDTDELLGLERFLLYRVPCTFSDRLTSIIYL